jgi:hypothetical protein
MKKSILLFAFTTLFFISCSSDSDNNSTIDTSQIVGVWFLESATIDGEEVGSSDEIEFKSNQRAFFTYYNFGSNGQDITESGDYSVGGSTLTISWDDSDPGNETLIFQILELTSSRLKLRSNVDGDILIETYTK